MSNTSNAGLGFKIMFISKIAAIVCTLMLLSRGLSGLGLIGVIVASIAIFVGMFLVTRDIEDCMTAFILLIVATAFELLARGNTLKTLFSLLSSVASFGYMFFLIKTVREELLMNNCQNTANIGDKVWNITKFCLIATIVLSALAFIPVINIFAAIASLCIPVLTLISGVLYIIYLYGCSKAFA